MYELIFDVIIALIVAAVPLYVVARRDKPFGPLQAALVLFWGVIVYGSFIETRMLRVQEHVIDVRPVGTLAMPRQMDLAVISDLHLGKYRHAEWLERVVAAINAWHPDAVLIAGDLATSEGGTAGYAPLEKLKSRHGTYAVLGNWDYKTGAVTVRRAIEGHRVEVLTDESVQLGSDEAPVRLIGLDDWQYGDPDWDAAFAGVSRDETTVLLVHEPDAAPEAEVRGVSLVIVGHTHGGQVRLPIIGAVPHIPIGIGQSFDRGLFSFGPTRLFITTGVGESGPRARFMQPPQIDIVHLIY